MLPVPTAVALAPGAAAWQSGLPSRAVLGTFPELHPAWAAGGSANSTAAVRSAHQTNNEVWYFCSTHCAI